MAVLFSWDGGDAGFWRTEMTKVLGPFDFRVFPKTGNRDEIEYALVWEHPVGDFKTYSNLRAVFSIAAGVEHVLRDPELPRGVPIVRLTDEIGIQDMTCHVIHWALHFHRSYHRYVALQKSARWEPLEPVENGLRRIGVLGLGNNGSSVARGLANFGFDVAGWSRTRKELSGISCYSGAETLSTVLARSEILICALPLTGMTANLLTAPRFARMPKGAFVINCGRGEIVDDGDLIDALDRGQLEAAALDVFREEPLPKRHPFWSHPKIYITPHAAAATNQRSASHCIARNIKRMEAGEAPFPIVNLDQGY